MSSGESAKKNERARDLLADRALGALSDDDRDELAHLLAEGAEEDDGAFEAAAAAVHLAAMGKKAGAGLASMPVGAWPASLAEKVEREGRAALAERRPAAGVRDPAEADESRPTRRSARPEVSTTAAGAQVLVMPVEAPAKRDFTRWTGWLAAAACAGLLVAQALRGAGPGQMSAGSSGWSTTSDRGPLQTETSVAGGDRGGATRVASLVAASGAPAGVAGTIEWNEVAARGVLRVKALPAGTYEVWIEDGARDDRHSLAAASFVAREGVESVVPVNPAIAPQRAKRLVVVAAADESAVLVTSLGMP